MRRYYVAAGCGIGPIPFRPPEHIQGGRVSLDAHQEIANA